MMRGTQTAALLVLITLAGCGSEEDSYTLIPVQGKITLNNKPLANAKVSFVPDQGNKVSTPGVDETGPEGNYKLRFKNRFGVAPGKYTVVVTPSADLPAGAKVPEVFKDDPMMAQMAAGVGVPGLEKKTKEVLKNEFTAEVDSQNNTFDYDVKASGSGAAKK